MEIAISIESHMYMHVVCKSLSSNQSVSVRHVVDMHAFHCCVIAEIPTFLLHDADSSDPAAPQKAPFHGQSIAAAAMPASVRGAWLAIPDTALLLRIVLVEDVPVGLVVVGVREAPGWRSSAMQAALPEGHHIGVPPGRGAVGSAAVDDPLVVHCDVACTQTPEHFQAPLARIPACVCLLCTHAAAQITMSA